MKVPKYFKVLISTTHVKLEPIFNDDVVEVVRCKDCKHCEHSDFPSMDYCFRKEPYIFEVDAEFYCKGGERKETE